MCVFVVTITVFSLVSVLSQFSPPWSTHRCAPHSPSPVAVVEMAFSEFAPHYSEFPLPEGLLCLGDGGAQWKYREHQKEKRAEGNNNNAMRTGKEKALRNSEESK